MPANAKSHDSEESWLCLQWCQRSHPPSLERMSPAACESSPGFRIVLLPAPSRFGQHERDARAAW